MRRSVPYIEEPEIGEAIKEFIGSLKDGYDETGGKPKQDFRLWQLGLPLALITLAVFLLGHRSVTVYFGVVSLIAVGFAGVLTGIGTGQEKGVRKGLLIGYEHSHPVEYKPQAHAYGRLQIGADLIMSGNDGPYTIELDKEPNPHVVVIGESGAGKTTFVEAFLLRATNEYKIPFLVLDWSGSYSKLERAGVSWNVPKDLKVNPFALHGLTPEKRAGAASEMLMRTLELTPLQAQRVRETLMPLYGENVEPTLEILLDRLYNTKSASMRNQALHIANKLKQTREVFGDEPKEFWSSYGNTCNIVSMEGLTDTEKNIVTHSLLQRIIESFGHKGETRLYIALDDAYQALASYEGRESPITKIVREGRKYGFGMIISTQILQDLPDAILGNTSMKFLASYHEPAALEKVCVAMHLSELEKEILHRAPRGTGFLFDQHRIQNGDTGYPAFISVLRVTEKELLAVN